MSKIKVADFYYGAVLSMLFNNKINPALVESNDSRQIYDFTTNRGEFRIFIKYRADRQATKTIDYNSWVFNLTETDKIEIKNYIASGYNLLLTLVCGIEGLSDSEVAVVDKEQVEELMHLGKDSITISRKKNEKSYRISIGGGRENAILVRSNRFEELF